MSLLKVKQWLKNPNSQFKIDVKNKSNSQINSVYRLKDNKKFALYTILHSKIFDGKSFIYFITAFSDDLIHVELSSRCEGTPSQIVGKLQIDELDWE